MENLIKQCLLCENELKGRSDKKFCSDQCRAAFNNRHKNEEEKLLIKVNAVLRKNRTIMKRINPNGNSTVGKEFLLALGFNFKYFTNIYQNNSGSEYCFCYDHGFMLLENGKVLLVNYQAYMKDTGGK
ncbi:MAG: hypothetical protein M3512_12690 [Bacteroidota bacterium]|nr:hypothetical protein [Bacteroidota bacterium]